LVCWMSSKQVWCQHLVTLESSCFLSVMWCREALYMLGVKGVEALSPLGAFFLPRWLQKLNKIFDLWSSNCFCTLAAILDPLNTF
jgi:hypothetical protein